MSADRPPRLAGRIRRLESEGAVWMDLGRMSGRRSRKSAWLTFFVILFLLAAAAYVFVDSRIRPMLALYGGNQATTAATRAVNDAADSVLSEMNLTYDDIAQIDRDSNGRILSIESNTETMNRLKSAVSKKILEQLNTQDSQTVKIPLGSLIGGLMTGRGPEIRIRVPLNATVETTFQNRFESAGINQTRHEISLEVKVTAYAVIRNADTAVESNTTFAIAENVLVGEVPQWVVGSQIAGN